MRFKVSLGLLALTLAVGCTGLANPTPTPMPTATPVPTPTISGSDKLQSQMRSVIAAESRNAGIEVLTYFKDQSSVLMFDVQSVSPERASGDVFRVFLQFAEKVQAMNFETVELASRGTTKFVINGTYFHDLGAQYSTQNPVYTLRTFPENLKRPDGSRAYPEVAGGLLYVLREQMAEFNTSQREWYLDDNGLVDTMQETIK